MKKLSIKAIKDDLIELEASKAQIEIVLNNVKQYNQLVAKFLKGEETNNYLIYQLNIAINNQLANLQRKKERQQALQLKIDEAKRKAEERQKASEEAEPLDNILQMIKQTKQGK
jgi:hypothetical protein